jgi:hypothetical protein
MTLITCSFLIKIINMKLLLSDLVNLLLFVDKSTLLIVIAIIIMAIILYLTRNRNFSFI